MKKTTYPEIILPNLGAKSFRWFGDKGYLVTFVYSNKGNFVLKGFAGETNIALKQFVERGYRFYYRYNYFHGGKVRYSNVKFWKDTVWVRTPEARKSKYSENLNKFEFRTASREYGQPSILKLALKRLPNRWIPEFENL